MERKPLALIFFRLVLEAFLLYLLLSIGVAVTMRHIYNHQERTMYNHQEMIDIPMREVLADYGIQVNSRGMFRLRDERTASAKYYEKTNTFYDFGAGIGGNNINLIQALRQCDKDTAKGILGEDYGLSLHVGEVGNLSNAQFER
ncbi:MAG: hypothetical protein FWD84_05905, partial [Oscillospiraceae bacterium]|nr:hypothetical protein [Oscillospiraceae bacterium]